MQPSVEKSKTQETTSQVQPKQPTPLLQTLQPVNTAVYQPEFSMTTKILKTMHPDKVTKKLIIPSNCDFKLRIAVEFAKYKEISAFCLINKQDANTFVMEDVLFPPQENQGAFVTTNDEKYPIWMYENVTAKNLNDKVRLHFHTHPNFRPFPSGTDVNQFNEIMQYMTDYMLQMIMNNDRSDYFCALHTPGQTIQHVEVVFEETEKIKAMLELQTTVNKVEPRITYQYDPKVKSTSSYHSIEDYEEYEQAYYNRAYYARLERTSKKPTNSPVVTAKLPSKKVLETQKVFQERIMNYIKFYKKGETVTTNGPQQTS